MTEKKGHVTQNPNFGQKKPVFWLHRKLLMPPGKKRSRHAKRQRMTGKRGFESRFTNMTQERQIDSDYEPDETLDSDNSNEDFGDECI